MGKIRRDQRELLQEQGQRLRFGAGSGPLSVCVGLVLAAIAAAALSASPAASAKPGYTTYPGERFSQLNARGTQGFQITIKRIAGRVELTASRRTATAIYIVRSEKASADGIKATFPGLGRVSVRFHPSGRVQRGPAFCRGRPWFTQHGIFSGVIRFEGELGFTRIALQNARGFVHRRFRETCKGKGNSGAGRSRDFPFYSFAERGRSQGRTTFFTTLKRIDETAVVGSATYFASQQERRHGMTSVREASVSADPDTFAIAGPPSQPESATITPPPPFSGTASFQASPGALAEWEGTLAVELPGVETVQLTGSQFRPVLCRGRRCLGQSPSVRMLALAQADRAEQLIQEQGIGVEVPRFPLPLAGWLCRLR